MANEGSLGIQSSTVPTKMTSDEVQQTTDSILSSISLGDVHYWISARYEDDTPKVTMYASTGELNDNVEREGTKRAVSVSKEIDTLGIPEWQSLCQKTISENATAIKEMLKLAMVRTIMANLTPAPPTPTTANGTEEAST